jgi:hypothetical protein
MAIKTIDEKGRLTLGTKFAGKIVKIEEKDDHQLEVTICRVVPEREAWLWDNPIASQLVSIGVDQAHRGELTEGPDLAAAFAFADEIPDDE